MHAEKNRGLDTDGDLGAWGGEVGSQDQAGVGVRVDGREVSESGAVVRRVHAGQLTKCRAANTPHRLVSMDCGTQTLFACNAVNKHLSELG